MVAWLGWLSRGAAELVARWRKLREWATVGKVAAVTSSVVVVTRRWRRRQTGRTRRERTYERRREKDRDCEGGRGTVKVLTFDKPPPPRAAPRSRPRPPPQPATPASLSPFVVLASSCSRFAYSPFTPPRLSQTIIRTIRNRRRLASRDWSVGLASSARGVKGHRENCRHRPDTSVPSSRDIVLRSTFLLLFFPSKYTITWIRSCNLILSFRFFSFFFFLFFY